jgi:uncharacterized protein (TIGR00255 family)
MTGYGVCTRESDAGTITLELRSVNSRFLDLQFRMNDDLRTLEPVLREAITARIQRGKVECRLSFGRKLASANSLAVDPTLLSALSSVQQQVLGSFPEARPLSVNELLRWPGVLAESELSQETLAADVQAALVSVLSAFIESRQREGSALQAMLLSRISQIEAIVERITPLVPRAIENFRQKAIERMQEALSISLSSGNGSASVPKEDIQDRIRQEVTLYGIKVDVAEELTRLAGHLNETRAILNKGGQVGKRLDFMMQELNREANTLGSKAAVKELSDASMEMKLLIEQMREQVQNLE